MKYTVPIFITLMACFIGGAFPACQTAATAPPRDSKLAYDVRTGSWRHELSGIVFPRRIADFERQTVAPDSARDGIIVCYSNGARMSDRLRGVVNESVSVFPTGGMDLSTAFKMRTAAALRYACPGGRVSGTNAVRAEASGKMQPGLRARISYPGRDANGYNMDGAAEVALYRWGPYFVEFDGSMSVNRAEEGWRAIQAFEKNFALPAGGPPSSIQSVRRLTDARDFRGNLVMVQPLSFYQAQTELRPPYIFPVSHPQPAQALLPFH